MCIKFVELFDKSHFSMHTNILNSIQKYYAILINKDGHNTSWGGGGINQELYTPGHVQHFMGWRWNKPITIYTWTCTTLHGVEVE